MAQNGDAMRIPMFALLLAAACGGPSTSTPDSTGAPTPGGAQDDADGTDAQNPGESSTPSLDASVDRGGSSRDVSSGSSSDAGDASELLRTDASTAFMGSSTFVLSAYKDVSINMNWNTNVVSAKASGNTVALATDLAANGAGAITLAFATGECGNESWAGVAGDVLASTNVPLLTQAGVRYIVSTGGAAGSFTCGTDAGFAAFLARWASQGLVGVDFDIEAGQTTTQIHDLIQRIQTAHGSSPALRFSLTLATLANNGGAAMAASMGAAAQDSFNTYGDQVMAAVESVLGFSGTASTWPAFLTVDLMTMDYGSPTSGVCVVSSGRCQMGQSAVQAAFNLHDRWGVPYGAIELTPMIGQNDASDEQFTSADVDAVSAFVVRQGLAGVHYWSYDRDADCPVGSASATCSSMGSGYAGDRGYLRRFISDGL